MLFANTVSEEAGAQASCRAFQSILLLTVHRSQPLPSHTLKSRKSRSWSPPFPKNCAA